MLRILIDLSLPSADAVVHNSRILINRQFAMCNNDTVSWFACQKDMMRVGFHVTFFNL